MSIPTPTAIPFTFVLRLDVGSPSSYTDQDGEIWLADRVYSAGSFGHLVGGVEFMDTSPVPSTLDPLLYQTYRLGATLEFQADLPADGTYEVFLKFADFLSTGLGQNICDVRAQGNVEIAGLDVFGLVGSSSTHDEPSFSVSVTPGPVNSLEIEFSATFGECFVSAIEIRGTVPHPLPLDIFLDKPAGADLVP